MRMGRAAVLVALLAVVAAPAAAGGHDDGAYFVGIEGKFLQPTNLGGGYVLVDPVDDSVPEGSIAGAEFSSEFSPAILIGQAYGNGAGWAIGYWSFDEEARDRRTSPSSGELWDILLNPDVSEDDFVGSADALSEVEADTIDLVYWRQVAGTDAFRLTWAAGLRIANFENVLSVNYDEDADLDGTLESSDDVVLSSESEGIGLMTGLRGSVQLGSRWSAYVGAAISRLSGEVEGSSLAIDDGSLVNRVEREEDRALTILDIELGISYQVSDGWYVKIGYESSEWSDVLTRDLFPDDVSVGFAQTTSSDVSWDGLSFGIGATF